MELRQAERQQAKIKLGIQGPSGSGKTYSALLVARGLASDWSKVAIIDTENHSADLYAHLGNFNVLSLSELFSPERYVEAIETCENEGMEVIIIDSITPEWDGEGGILEVHGNLTGNSFTNWRKVTPRHNKFVQKIIQSNCHILSTIRSKQDYVLSEKNGKYVPEKVGLKGITREGMDYEFTIVFDLDIKHNATASKDRTEIFMDKPPIILSDKIGIQIKSWCAEGKTLDEVIELIKEAQTVEDIRRIYKQYPQMQAEIEPVCIQRKQEIEDPVINQVEPENL